MRPISLLSKIASASAALLYWSGAVRPVSGGARILTLHGTPRRDAAQLARQLAYLRRQFRVVPLAFLLDRLAKPGADVDGMVVLTFDDGLRSNVEVAYPLLRRLGLPATFYICPQLIDEGRWLWTHEMRCRLRWLGWPMDVDAFVEKMKRMDIERRRELEHAVQRASSDFVASAAQREDHDLATWDELRALDPAIISIGSHTLTHPVLPSLDAAALEHEIGESRRLIEARLGRAADTFCYPNGEHHGAARDCVRRHYRAALTDRERSARPGADLHALPRVYLPEGTLRLALRMNRRTKSPGEPQIVTSAT